MATWVIGDIHGCWLTLRRLLDAVSFDPARDRLWCVGDLVNRGPRSLEVLRFFRDLGDRTVVVLGNHDVHLLARAAGARGAARRDTLDEVLAAPDRDELLDWLARRPLVHREAGWLMAHAGLLPQWSDDEVAALAGELEERLGAGDWRDTLAAIHRIPRLRAILDVLTRLRTCTAAGAPCFDYTGPPAGAPRGCRPWFELREPLLASRIVLFGHWAALGFHRSHYAIGLDTACVWGGTLSAYRLEEGELRQLPMSD